MYVDRHIIYGIIFSFFLFPLFSWYSITIFIASVLIDIDHYIFYIFRTGKTGIIGSIRYFIENRPKDTMLLHTFELLFLILILSFFEKTFLYIFLGFGSHIFLDLIDMIRKEDFNMQKFTLLDLKDQEPT